MVTHSGWMSEGKNSAFNGCQRKSCSLRYKPENQGDMHSAFSTSFVWMLIASPAGVKSGVKRAL